MEVIAAIERRPKVGRSNEGWIGTILFLLLYFNLALLQEPDSRDLNLKFQEYVSNVGIVNLTLWTVGDKFL